MGKQLLTPEQLQHALQVGKNTIPRWRKKGLPYKKLGERIFRYDLDEVLAWMDENEKTK